MWYDDADGNGYGDGGSEYGECEEMGQSNGYVEEGKGWI